MKGTVAGPFDGQVSGTTNGTQKNRRSIVDILYSECTETSREKLNTALTREVLSNTVVL